MADVQITAKTKLPLTSGKEATLTLKDGEVEIVTPVSLKQPKTTLANLRVALEDLEAAQVAGPVEDADVRFSADPVFDVLATVGLDLGFAEDQIAIGRLPTDDLLPVIVKVERNGLWAETVAGPSVISRDTLDLSEVAAAAFRDLSDALEAQEDRRARELREVLPEPYADIHD